MIVTDTEATPKKMNLWDEAATLHSEYMVEKDKKKKAAKFEEWQSKLTEIKQIK